MESRNKGRRRPGATGALTDLGALFPRKQEGGHIAANIVPAKWTAAAPGVSPGNKLHRTRLPGRAHGGLPQPRNSAFQSRPHPLGGSWA